MSGSILLTGNDNLTIQCGSMLLEAGHVINAVLARDRRIQDWAKKAAIPVVASDDDLKGVLAGKPVDWLLSVANTDIISDETLAFARNGAINFHDGPLPRYAGLNAPVWAILNGEASHGITWHMIEGGVDEGDIVVSRNFEISEGETALTLNAKCFAAAIESFEDVIKAISGEVPVRIKQDLSARTYFGRHDRPSNGAFLDFTQPAADMARLVNALNHGSYRNPLAAAKFVLNGQMILTSEAKALPGEGRPGVVSGQGEGCLTIGTTDGVVRLGGLTDTMGAPIVVMASPGDALDVVDGDAAGATIKDTARSESRWEKRFSDYRPALWCEDTGEEGEWTKSLSAADPSRAAAAFSTVVSSLCGFDAVDLAFGTNSSEGLSQWAPVRFNPGEEIETAKSNLTAALEESSTKIGFAVDLPARISELAHRAMPDAGMSAGGAVAGCAITLALSDGSASIHADLSRITLAEADFISDRVRHLTDKLGTITADTPVVDLPILPDAERKAVLFDWNTTETEFSDNTCVHQFFEEQVRRRPNDTALVFEGSNLTYAELNARANRLANVLIDVGVEPDQPVGLHIRRSLEMVVGALGIMKAGGAYLPLDPGYPADRIKLYIEDSGAGVIVTEAALQLETTADQINIDMDPRLDRAKDTDPETAVSSGDLAYMIYTSGSTGRPKGVMVEHRNVANFFTGIDARVKYDPPGVMLAITSLSFDISVLELFWTLARGFKVVISGEEKLVAGAEADHMPQVDCDSAGMEFSLFYWGNDDGVGRDKYALLLEGAQFADQNGFCAVWTPERHFHSFGGLYPNPSVTGAAVAAVTENISVRAGSCVAPLHHIARVAEEWAVIDNLTNGRAGLAIASGWQPDDFVLRPENAPPNNKPAMLDSIRDLRKLWSGEEVEFPKADGSMIARLTQPRPVSKEFPIWVTTAGNPDTWKQAGEIGANVLTHLLGQTVEEVGEKIKLYHAALRQAGHDPADFTVTLMLHTYIADDRETARDIAREPMKDYLRAAADLIKQYAWAFPAFKRPEGVDTARQIDLGSLEPDELEAILDFAFERYFEKSGLFGTIDDALERVAEVKAFGVTEVACLIDYGIARETVLAGLRPLAEVVGRANANATPSGDWSIAAQIERHEVTHFQCTPYMARMLVTNDDSRAALSGVKHLMIGGEALSGTLVSELRAATKASIENMYGPTETTIWSTTERGSDDQAVVGIGRPIANTQTYVLDDDMTPRPAGVTGQLWIGGEGVTRGYWNRDDLTSEKFREDPFRDGNRIFGTGDLVRWRADGRLDFLGRSDAQVKIRGFRIELGEIEAALEAEAGVNQAVVTAEPDASGVGMLTAYVTGKAEIAHLLANLAALLPAHMVPARIHSLGAFPLTPNKKIDRKALPSAVKVKPDAIAKPKVVQPIAAAEEDTTAAMTKPELTAAISEIWSGVLGIDKINPSDSFFDLGGHSLLAVEAHRALRTRLGSSKLSIADIFRSPTLAGLVARVEALSGAASSDEPAMPSQAETLAASKVVDRRRALRQRRGQQH